MSFLACEKAIIDSFNTLIGATMPIAYDNDVFARTEQLTLWCRAIVGNGDSRQSSIGSEPSYRHFGVFMIQLFCRKGSGVGDALVKADQIASYYQSRQLTPPPITFQTPSVKKIGEDSMGWYQINVLCPFFREEI